MQPLDCSGESFALIRASSAAAPSGTARPVCTSMCSPTMARHRGLASLTGADGGRSFVRHTLDIGFPGQTLGVRPVVADVVLTGLERDAWHGFHEGSMSRQMALCLLAGTELFQLQAPIPLEGDVDLSAEGLSRMVAERTGRDDIPIQSVHWASAYKMNARLADRYLVGRVLLIGDAADIHPRPAARVSIPVSRMPIISAGSWAQLPRVRPTLCSTAMRKNAGQSRRACSASPPSCSMPPSEANCDADRKSISSTCGVVARARKAGTLAGDRAPDAPIRGAAGQPTRLFQLFKGPHWTLLGYDVERDAIPPRQGLHIHTVGARGDIFDEDRYLRDAYGLAPGDWALVRPDGYIGAIVSSGEIQALETYLRSVGLEQCWVSKA
jgi:FAD binding domain